MTRYLIVETSGNVSSNPTIRAVIDELLNRNHGVDLVVPAGSLESDVQPLLWRGRIRVRDYHPEFSHGESSGGFPVQLARRAKRTLKHLRSGAWRDPLSAERRRVDRYGCILGVDPHGLIAAHRINQFADRPLAYLSFELLLKHELEGEAEFAFKRRETEAIEKTQLFLLQDEERCRLFCNDNDVTPENCVFVPVAPPDQHPAKTHYLHDKLNMPRSTRIVLYQGSLSTWSGRDEFEEMVSYWPDDVTLVIHSRYQVNRRMRNYIDQMASSGKIVLSDQPVSAEELPTLTASADIGLAGYRPDPDHWTHGDNLRYIGLASGKIAYYAMAGLPILAREMPTLTPMIEDNDIGRCYRRLAETGELVRQILDDHERLSQRSRDFYCQSLAPEKYVPAFCDALDRLAQGNSADLARRGTKESA